jgi:crossover junction endodeoxyribonuclease RuvC
MRVLGVDPGLRVTGYGAVDCGAPLPHLIEAGVITPDIKAPLEQRLGELSAGMRDVIAAVRPDVMVVEELWTSYKNPTTAILMGHARGVLYLAAHAHGVPVRHLAHASVKRALTGSGAARKDQVNRMVVTLLRLTTIPEPNDVSDALALALAHANIAAVERGLTRAVLV